MKIRSPDRNAIGDPGGTATVRAGIIRCRRSPNQRFCLNLFRPEGDVGMCKLCEAGQPQFHLGSRRNFLKGAVATGVAAAGLNLFAARPAAADDPPPGSGQPGRRYIIRGGSVMTLDPQVGDFAQADVLHVVELLLEFMQDPAQLLGDVG